MSEGNSSLMERDSRVLGTPAAVKKELTKLRGATPISDKIVDLIDTLCDASDKAPGVEVDLVCYRDRGAVYLSLTFKQVPLVQE